MNNASPLLISVVFIGALLALAAIVFLIRKRLLAILVVLLIGVPVAIAVFSVYELLGTVLVAAIILFLIADYLISSQTEHIRLIVREELAEIKALREEESDLAAAEDYDL